MSAQAATWYGANTAVFARATLAPRSNTSGALSVPLLAFAASISCWLLASGCCSVDLDLGYFALNACEDALVVRPVGRKRDDVERALGLGGRDERVHAAQRGRRWWRS